mmetsp:Transcript_2367/g.8692  ORF Transcript_2367/g.8692 Transcript_2367/m.8692 type:complete len:285 (-) Transcript_2367:1963-2817(-)
MVQAEAERALRPRLRGIHVRLRGVLGPPRARSLRGERCGGAQPVPGPVPASGIRLGRVDAVGGGTRARGGGVRAGRHLLRAERLHGLGGGDVGTLDRRPFERLHASVRAAGAGECDAECRPRRSRVLGQRHRWLCVDAPALARALGAVGAARRRFGHHARAARRDFAPRARQAQHPRAPRRDRHLAQAGQAPHRPLPVPLHRGARGARGGSPAHAPPHPRLSAGRRGGCPGPPVHARARPFVRARRCGRRRLAARVAPRRGELVRRFVEREVRRRGRALPPRVR